MVEINIRALVDEDILYEQNIVETNQFSDYKLFNSNNINNILEKNQFEIIILKNNQHNEQVVSTYKKNRLVCVILVSDKSQKQISYSDYVVSSLNEYQSAIEKAVFCLKEIYSNQLFELFGQLIKVRTIDGFNQVDHVKKITEVLVNHLNRISHPYIKDIDESMMQTIIFFSGIHDLGKIMVSEALLTYKGIYNDKQREEMKQHTVLGAQFFEQILKNSPIKHLDIGKNIILYHHERFDGTGYPLRLMGLQIPLEARIVAVADVYDALVSDRIYKRAISHETAIQIIKDSRGTHFDPEIVDIFLLNEKQISSLKKTGGD